MIKMISISMKRFAVDSEFFKSDALGAIASGLCILHCLATPFFFIASACSLSCCNNAPLWWQWMDYVFLGFRFCYKICHQIVLKRLGCSRFVGSMGCLIYCYFKYKDGMDSSSRKYKIYPRICIGWFTHVQYEILPM